MRYSTLLMIGWDMDDKDELLNKRVSEIEPGQVWVITYTSDGGVGTNFSPKGVMLSHDNLIYSVCSLIRNTELDPRWNVRPMRLLNFLPMCHIFAFQIDFVYPLVVWWTCTDNCHSVRNQLYTPTKKANPTTGDETMEASETEIAMLTSCWLVYFARPYDVMKNTI